MRFAFLLLAGCSAPLPEGFPEDLQVTGACSDLLFYAATDGGSMRLSGSNYDGLVADALAAGEATTTEHDLSSDEGTAVQLDHGYRVGAGGCYWASGAVSEEQWWAVDGLLTITITPDTSGQGDHTASVQFEDVDFQNEGRVVGTLEDFEIAGVIGP